MNRYRLLHEHCSIVSRAPVLYNIRRSSSLWSMSEFLLPCSECGEVNKLFARKKKRKEHYWLYRTNWPSTSTSFTGRFTRRRGMTKRIDPKVQYIEVFLFESGSVRRYHIDLHIECGLLVQATQWWISRKAITTTLITLVVSFHVLGIRRKSHVLIENNVYRLYSQTPK